MSPRPRRSCLTVPASSARMLEKAAALPADEVVVDLEDGVAAEAKEEARGRLGDARATGTLAIRINGLATPWWRDDLAAALAVKPDVIVLPKAETAEEVASVIELLPDGVGLEVFVETARALVEVEAIAALGAPLEALVFGRGARKRAAGDRRPVCSARRRDGLACVGATSALPWIRRQMGRASETDRPCSRGLRSDAGGSGASAAHPCRGGRRGAPGRRDGRRRLEAARPACSRTCKRVGSRDDRETS